MASVTDRTVARARELIAQGVPRARAAAQALREIASPAAAREKVRAIDRALSLASKLKKQKATPKEEKPSPAGSGRPNPYRLAADKARELIASGVGPSEAVDRAAAEVLWPALAAELDDLRAGLADARGEVARLRDEVARRPPQPG